MQLHWIPREQNEDADDLSKGRLDNFDPKKRIEVDVESLPLEVIPAMAEAAEKLDEEIKMRKVSKQRLEPSAKTPAEEKMRLKEPW